MNKTTQFDDVFPVNCQVDAIPPSLQTIVAMLCHGASIIEYSLATQNQALLSICQLIIFNSLSRSGKRTSTTWHNKACEPPLPVYLGNLMHTKIRKQALVESLYELGLSVSFDRVLDISIDVDTKICKFYDRLKTVCPPQLKQGAFTTSAVDNINHQASAMTAKNSFNGTSVSIFQHFSSTDQTTAYEPVMAPEEFSESISRSTNLPRKTLPKLPQSYTQVSPVTESQICCPFPRISQPVMIECPLMTPALQLEYRYEL